MNLISGKGASMQQSLNVAARAFAGLVLAAVATWAAAQQPYPTKPIRIIVPLTPSGSTDNLTRLIGAKLKDRLGQPVVVENRPGANTIVGTEAVARSAPDGYTLLVASNTHVIIPLLAPKLPYDALKDFAPVATLASSRYVMAVHPSVPANTLQELIALAKKKPGELNYGSSGAASGSRIAGELFNVLAGVRIQNIPYKGGAQALSDVIGGQLQLSYNTPMVAAPYVNTGRLKALAVSGDTRIALLPQVPTFAEAGLPGFDEQPWQGMFAPAATPKPVVDKLSTEIAKILAAPDMKAVFEKQDVEPFISTPEQFAAMLKAETAKLAKLVKAANIKLEN
jgi:tripartite-type tricarboxylate transporter receptor subunit TctC